MLPFFYVFFLFWEGAASEPIRHRNHGLLYRGDAQIDPAEPVHTPCLDVFAYAAQGVNTFWASDVFDCLKNVPFNPAVATRFLDYYNKTLQFQSTLDLLENPPEGYQQPPVNVRQELEGIKANISAGAYKNQYGFEADVQLLINRFHDNHITLNAGLLSAFVFASPYGLVSASRDGKRAPEIFLKDEIISSRLENREPSPVTHINNEEVVAYLTRFAELNSDGYLEPHADWNTIMDHPARDIQGDTSGLQRAFFYPGDDLTFTFGDNTTLPAWWWALYRGLESTGPLTTPGDFFNFFVLGHTPAGYDEQKHPKWWPDNYNYNITSEETRTSVKADNGSSAKSSQKRNWYNISLGAYPNNPVVAQANLSITGRGSVTGYILEDISTAVLSIPRFYQTTYTIQTFHQAINDFIVAARNQSRIVIDLQQNQGGLVLLALTTFKQFFPQMDPYTGSRMRSHDAADILGSAYTQWWDSLDVSGDSIDIINHDTFAASEWVATNRINAATGRKFSSWAEYYGPVFDHGNAVSQQQLYNLSDQTFDESMFGYVPPAYAEPNGSAPAQIWAPEDIVILTDGLCSSACALFVELMANQAGVQTITVGGRPTKGPMQTASGNRGARIYSSSLLLRDFNRLNNTVDNQTAFNRLPSIHDTGMKVHSSTFNIRDQMRPNDTTPLQFKYEAAQCRLYYTIGNVYNMSQLWRDVAAATWTDPSRCVDDSTGYAKAPNATSGTKKPPERTAEVPYLDPELIYNDNTMNISTDGLVDYPKLAPTEEEQLATCNNGDYCNSGATCVTFASTCRKNGKDVPGPNIDLCPTRCSNWNKGCNDCEYLFLNDESKSLKTISASDKKKLQNGWTAQGQEYIGYCPPRKIYAAEYGLSCL